MVVERQKLIAMYRVMIRIRAFEERVAKEFSAGKIPGFVHLSIGQEAVAAGACANLTNEDYITSTHRGHGHLIAKGGRTDRMMAELFGKKNGYNKGKGGSMHIADVDIGMLGANGIVGAGIPIAGGAAMSAQMQGTDQVAVCFLGDAATNTTRFHEGINLSACWNLPVVYIIENNMYGNSTNISKACKLADLADRACAYGIPGKTIDGNDVLTVFEVVGEAVDRARNGEGPTLIECKTYRWHGHFEGDTMTYRTKKELEEWIKKDPIPRFRSHLAGMNILTKEYEAQINHEAQEEMEKAVKFAEESPFAALEEILEDVYA